MRQNNAGPISFRCSEYWPIGPIRRHASWCSGVPPATDLWERGEFPPSVLARTDAPRMTPSIRAGLRELGLARIVIVYPGTKRYPIADRVEAIPSERLADDSPLFTVDAA